MRALVRFTPGAQVIAILVLLAGLAFGMLTIAIARREPAYAFVGGRSSSTPRTRLAAVGSCRRAACGRARGRLVTAGDRLAAWMRRPTVAFGPLLAAGAFGWFALEWNNPGIGSAAGFAVGLLSVPPLRR